MMLLMSSRVNVDDWWCRLCADVVVVVVDDDRRLQRLKPSSLSQQR